MIAIMSQSVYDTIASMADAPRRFSAGEVMFRQGDAVRSFFAVRSGGVRLVRHGERGDTLVLQRAYAGDLVAEASVYSDAYHCDAECLAETTVLCLPVDRFRKAVSSDPDFAGQWAVYLARSVQNARARAEILAAPTVDRRLASWRALYGDLPEKGRWKELALEIGVTPEALYRCLARARRAG